MVSIVKELFLRADDMVVVTCSHTCQLYLIHGTEFCRYKETGFPLNQDNAPWHPFFLRPAHPGKWHAILNIYAEKQKERIMYSVNIIHQGSS